MQTPLCPPHPCAAPRASTPGPETATLAQGQHPLPRDSTPHPEPAAAPTPHSPQPGAATVAVVKSFVVVTHDYLVPCPLSHHHGLKEQWVPGHPACLHVGRAGTRDRPLSGAQMQPARRQPSGRVREVGDRSGLPGCRRGGRAPSSRALGTESGRRPAEAPPLGAQSRARATRPHSRVPPLSCAQNRDAPTCRGPARPPRHPPSRARACLTCPRTAGSRLLHAETQTSSPHDVEVAPRSRLTGERSRSTGRGRVAAAAL